MLRACSVCALLLSLVGCAAKQPVKAAAKMVVPVSCITDLQLQAAMCEPNSASTAVCNHVQIKFACAKIHPEVLK